MPGFLRESDARSVLQEKVRMYVDYNSPRAGGKTYWSADGLSRDEKKLIRVPSQVRIHKGTGGGAGTMSTNDPDAARRFSESVGMKYKCSHGCKHSVARENKWDWTE